MILFPRPTRRGLIEATISPSLLVASSKFPRPTRRGLIEASHPALRKLSLGRSFPRPTRRGLIEAGRPRLRRRWPDSFPRPTRRGLIEAGAPSRAAPPERSRFRAQRGAASLKPNAILRRAKTRRVSAPNAARPH